MSATETDRVEDEKWLDILAEMKRRHPQGENLFVVRVKDGTPKVIAAEERGSHTAT
jgi:hypothetical protein